MFHRTAGVAATLAALALPLIAIAPSSADASPKRYDIQQLLYQDLPAWRRGGRAAAPAPAPQAAPPAPILRRAPTPPASSPAPAVAAPAPAAPAAAPGGRRVIRAPGAPRSTVSGAWSGGN